MKLILIGIKEFNRLVNNIYCNKNEKNKKDLFGVYLSSDCALYQTDNLIRDIVEFREETNIRGCNRCSQIPSGESTRRNCTRRRYSQGQRYDKTHKWILPDKDQCARLSRQ